MKENDRPLSLKVIFPYKVEDRLAYHPLHQPNPSDPSHTLVSFARGFGAQGLERGYLKDAYLQHGNSLVTLAAMRDSETGKPRLVTKTIEVEGIGGNDFVMHFTCAD